MLTTRSLFKNALQRHSPSLQGRHAVAVPAVILTRRPFHATTTNFTASIPDFAREFQAKNIYTDRFPCTLHYYSSRGPKLLLYNHEEYEGDSDIHRLAQDAVTVNDQAIVDPKITSPWGGATMYPNTLLMLQITRSFSDWAEECKSKGEDVATPWFFTIPKGTSLPSHLFLVHEDLETFHLLPRKAKPLNELNHELNEFFGSHGSQLPEKEWHSKYFLEGYNTHEEKDWMPK